MGMYIGQRDILVQPQELHGYGQELKWIMERYDRWYSDNLKKVILLYNTKDVETDNHCIYNPTGHSYWVTLNMVYLDKNDVEYVEKWTKEKSYGKFICNYYGFNEEDCYWYVWGE